MLFGEACVDRQRNEKQEASLAHVVGPERRVQLGSFWGTSLRLSSYDRLLTSPSRSLSGPFGGPPRYRAAAQSFAPHMPGGCAAPGSCLPARRLLARLVWNCISYVGRSVWTVLGEHMNGIDGKTGQVNNQTMGGRRRPRLNAQGSKQGESKTGVWGTGRDDQARRVLGQQVLGRIGELGRGNAGCRETAGRRQGAGAAACCSARAAAGVAAGANGIAS